jgi:hypothetical protein
MSDGPCFNRDQHQSSGQSQQSSSLRGQPDEATSSTLSNHSRQRTSNVRPYVAEIDRLIESYRAGERPRFEILSAITRFLSEDGDLSPQERSQSFELFMAEVDSVKSNPRDKGKGKSFSRAGPITAEDRLSRATGRVVAGEGPDPGPGDDGSSEPGSTTSESGDEEPKKRRKLHASDMPWYQRQRFGESSQNPSCAKSAVIIRKFNRDLKSAKLFIKLAPEAPRGIPMSEWEHIFKGEAVDLDKIISSLHRVTFDPERKARIGDTEISISGAETKRKVETSSEWSTAWRSASRAIAFVFEHRERELSEYGDYIERLFAAKRASSHGQVILFDKGVRNEVGGGQTILLTDYNYFTSLYAATMQDDGVEYR